MPGQKFFFDNIDDYSEPFLIQKMEQKGKSELPIYISVPLIEGISISSFKKEKLLYSKIGNKNIQKIFLEKDEYYIINKL